jgi:uncharacterized membrane protein
VNPVAVLVYLGMAALSGLLGAQLIEAAHLLSHRDAVVFFLGTLAGQAIAVVLWLTRPRDRS